MGRALSPDPFTGTHPTPLGALGASINAPSALDLSTLPPLKLKAGYALDLQFYVSFQIGLAFSQTNVIYCCLHCSV